MRKIVQLPRKSSWVSKDQLKANKATCFIGHGSLASSTEAYRQAYDAVGLANKEQYVQSDMVFASVEGSRRGRVSAECLRDSLIKIKEAGAAVITDSTYHANRQYNVGEQELELILCQLGFRVHYYGDDMRVWS